MFIRFPKFKLIVSMSIHKLNSSDMNVNVDKKKKQ